MSIIDDLVKELKDKGYYVDNHNSVVETRPSQKYPYSKTYRRKYYKPLKKYDKPLAK